MHTILAPFFFVEKMEPLSWPSCWKTFLFRSVSQSLSKVFTTCSLSKGEQTPNRCTGNTKNIFGGIMPLPWFEHFSRYQINYERYAIQTWNTCSLSKGKPVTEGQVTLKIFLFELCPFLDIEFVLMDKVECTVWQHVLRTALVIYFCYVKYFLHNEYKLTTGAGYKTKFLA